MRAIYAQLALLPVIIATAVGQVNGSGTIQGTVADPSGAIIPSVTVTATNVETGVQTSRNTNDAGFFVLTPLQRGEYTVTAMAAGFQTLTQEHVRVIALETVGLNLKLDLGTASQTITVETSPPRLHTDDATLGSTMENEIYAALPLPMNGVPRDPTQFVATAPGVNNASTQAAGP